MKRTIQKTKKPASKKGGKEKKTVSIEFCPKCNSIMIPIKKGKNTILKCRNCGTERKSAVKSLKIMESVKKKEGVTILEKDVTPLPLTEKICPRCGHPRSHWWLQQTRTADEPPTQFFRCEKCKYTWREYK